jgi:GT2 family glycosyltransferase
VYDTDPAVLVECVDSVLAQTYRRWELCLVDDGSPAPHVWPLLQELATRDPRIRIARRARNGGIVAASNDALAMATGDVVALLDHDDLFHRRALELVAAEFRDPEVDYVYSDEDLVAPDGARFAPFFKPDWSPERFRTQMYTCHLGAMRRELIGRVGGFREGYDGSQDWDLVLRVTEAARKIVHIPEVLYHWRIVPTSVLAGDEVKPYAYEAAQRALQDHVDRVGIDGEVVELERRGHFRVVRRRRPLPKVSVVIPTRGSRGRAWGIERTMVLDAVRGVVETAGDEDLEIVVVADTATPAGVLVELADIAGERLRVVEWDRPFDFSAKCNLGASVASGEVLLFLNDDVEVITPDWLHTLVGFLREPDVGAAGCHLLFEDGRLQHAGHVLIGGNPGHLMFGGNPTSERNRMAMWLDREVAGVTAACLAIRADVFAEVGGFSPVFPNNYNDVDLCAKLRHAGYRIVVTPHARLYHFESVSRDPTVTDHELANLRSRWWSDLHRDPYYGAKHVPGLDGYDEPLSWP